MFYMIVQARSRRLRLPYDQATNRALPFRVQTCTANPHTTLGPRGITRFSIRLKGRRSHLHDRAIRIHTHSTHPSAQRDVRSLRLTQPLPILTANLNGLGVRAGLHDQKLVLL